MKLAKNIQSFLEETAENIANGESASFISDIEEAFDELDESEKPIISPVEQMFFIAWQFRMRGADKADPTEWIELLSQHQDCTTGKYRIDFAADFCTAIVNCSTYSIFNKRATAIFEKHPPPSLGIEIDGHIWHEKTKDQARRDKERERFLVANGWKLLRFTGSEVFHNAAGCVEEAVACAESLAKNYINAIVVDIKRGAL